MNFRKAKFQVIKDVVNRTFWETALRDKGAKEVWQIFKDAVCRAQELAKGGKVQARKAKDWHGLVRTC